MVRTYRSVPREFIAKMNDCVKQSDEMTSFGTYDPEAGA